MYSAPSDPYARPHPTIEQRDSGILCGKAGSCLTAGTWAVRVVEGRLGVLCVVLDRVCSGERCSE